MSLFSEYRSSLKLAVAEEFFDLVCFRPLAFLLVKVLKPTFVTPDQVTAASTVILVAAALLIGMGSPQGVFIAGVLVALGNVLDCADGQLARVTDRGSAYGRILDGVGDYISAISVFAAIGVHGSSFFPESALWWGLVVLAVISYGWQASLVDYYRNQFVGSLSGQKDHTEEELAEKRKELEQVSGGDGRWFLRFVLSAYVAYSAFQERFQRPQKDRVFVAAEKYASTHSFTIRLWCLNGSATPRFLLIIACLINRPDLFIFYVLSIGTLWALAALWVQKATEAAAARGAS